MATSDFDARKQLPPESDKEQRRRRMDRFDVALFSTVWLIIVAVSALGLVVSLN